VRGRSPCIGLAGEAGDSKGFFLKIFRSGCIVLPATSVRFFCAVGVIFNHVSQKDCSREQ